MGIKKIFPLALIMISASVSSAVQVSTGPSCENAEPLISLNKTDGGHVAEPGFYPHQICLDTENTEIKTSCGKREEILFTMDRKNNSHISIFENKYKYEMCSEKLDAEIVAGKSCVNGTKVASTTKKDNTHVAYPSYTQDPYNHSLCLTGKKPQSISLELSGISSPVYADGNQISTGETLQNPVEYPYIVSDKPLGIVSYGKFVKLSRPDSDTVSMTHTEGSFLIPMTKGGYIEIEDQQQEINDRTFLDLSSPNFLKPAPKKSQVRIAYNFENQVKTQRKDIREKGKIRLENKGLDENLDLVIELRN